MEKRLSRPKRFPISLKDLPPIDPSITNPSQVIKTEKPDTSNRHVPEVLKPRIIQEEKRVVKKFDHEGNTRADLLTDKSLDHNINTGGEDAFLCSVKHIDPNTFIKSKSKTKAKMSSDDKAFLKDPGQPKAVSPKAQLHEMCAAINWKNPAFECCKEEGPCHKKLFTYKVIIEIEREHPTVLECFGGPRPKKQTAAEHAAEGALWYLKHLGYFPMKKPKG